MTSGTAQKFSVFIFIMLSFFSHFAWSQADSEENFDPFTDYSEFDEASDEEADINFFRNGRFLTIGVAVGQRGFTDNYARAYTPALTYGLNLTYFFDLRIAAMLGYQTGDNNVSFRTFNGSKTYTGQVNFSTLDLNIKYYLNTQNVTKGLADLTPYVLGGLSQYSRTYNLTNVLSSGAERVTGLNIGGGIEIPMMRRRAFLGVQAVYHQVTFSDEGLGAIEEGLSTTQLEYTISGDMYDLMVIFGFNF